MAYLSHPQRLATDADVHTVHPTSIASRLSRFGLHISLWILTPVHGIGSHVKQEVKELYTSLPQTVRVATGKLQHILHILRGIQTNPVSALPPFHTTESQARAIRHVHIKLSKDLLHIVIVCINTNDEKDLKNRPFIM